MSGRGALLATTCKHTLKHKRTHKLGREQSAQCVRPCVCMCNGMRPKRLQAEQRAAQHRMSNWWWWSAVGSFILLLLTWLGGSLTWPPPPPPPSEFVFIHLRNKQAPYRLVVQCAIQIFSAPSIPNEQIDRLPATPYQLQRKKWIVLLQRW